MVRKFIDYKFPTLNEYINAERTNRYIAHNIKKQATRAVELICRKETPVEIYPVRIVFKWHIWNRSNDLDNTAFARKCILDGLQKAGILKNDNLTCIIELRDVFVRSKEFGVEVIIEEV